MSSAIIFLKSVFQNSFFGAVSRQKSGYFSLVNYEILWIHVIDSICRSIRVQIRAVLFIKLLIKDSYLMRGTRLSRQTKIFNFKMETTQLRLFLLLLLNEFGISSASEV